MVTAFKNTKGVSNCVVDFAAKTATVTFYPAKANAKDLPGALAKTRFKAKLPKKKDDKKDDKKDAKKDGKKDAKKDSGK